MKLNRFCLQMTLLMLTGCMYAPAYIVELRPVPSRDDGKVRYRARLTNNEWIELLERQLMQDDEGNFLKDSRGYYVPTSKQLYTTLQSYPDESRVVDSRALMQVDSPSIIDFAPVDAMPGLYFAKFENGVEGMLTDEDFKYTDEGQREIDSNGFPVLNSKALARVYRRS